MTIRLSIKHVSAVITAVTGLAFASVSQAQTIASNIQQNTGPITSSIYLKNIVVSGQAQLNATAAGNLISGEAATIKLNSQTNQGTINASTEILGTNTTFGHLINNTTSLGNGISSARPADALGTTNISSNTQNNSGIVGASIAWKADPTQLANLNAVAVGNMISVGTLK